MQAAKTGFLCTVAELRVRDTDKSLRFHLLETTCTRPRSRGVQKNVEALDTVKTL